MVFNSLVFGVFFVVVLSLYFLLKRHLFLQNMMLFVASSFFYGWWDWRFLLLMYLTIAIDFYIGRWIDKENSPRRRKHILIISIFFSLGILGFFKYFNFFTDSAIQLLNFFGITASPLFLEIVLPVGISFYTFQSMSYVIDIYYRRLKPATSMLDYATYVSLFPQLVAGPIERGTHLLPQVINPRNPNREEFFEGCYLILWGLFKKIFIADNLAKMVDPVFNSGSGYTGAEVLIATYAFAFQIYCDFSGYTDIARGTAKCMGFNLMLNFNLPYFSTNPSEFWRRWHISLSTWLRDYLYIPLGGNQKGNRRTYINLMITMVLGGLWHGARWNFIIWGAYQGLLLAIHRAISPWLEQTFQKARISSLITKPVLIVIFFQFVCVGWLIFRAESGAQIYQMTAALMAGINLSEVAEKLPKLMFYIAPLLLVQIAQYTSGNLNIIYESKWPVRAIAYIVFFYCILVFGNLDANEFIYFQF